jgi:hypothetical protein
MLNTFFSLFSEPDILEHEDQYEQFYSSFVALATHYLSHSLTAGKIYIFSITYTVFTKNFSDHKPTGPVNHQNPQAQILFCWPEKNT